jgi:hypothetical protein
MSRCLEVVDTYQLVASIVLLDSLTLESFAEVGNLAFLGCNPFTDERKLGLIEPVVGRTFENRLNIIEC